MNYLLSPAELKRYSRQIPIIGKEKQELLKSMKVGIVGLGGLGTIVSTYLVSMGIGELTIIDHDYVSLSNLNRQILYRTRDLGKQKVLVAKKRLHELNPNVIIRAFPEKLSSDNIGKLLNDVNVIFDCLDNWETRLLLDESAWHNNKILIHGGVKGFSGQVLLIIPKKTACLRCIVRNQRSEDKPPVLGPIVGIIGLLQIIEFMKYLVNPEHEDLGKLIFFDGLLMEINKIELNLTSECYAICKERKYAQHYSTYN